LIRRTLEWLSLALNITGGLVMALTKAYFLAATFFVVAFVIQVSLFLRDPAPPRRIDVVIFSLTASVVVFVLLAAFVFDITQDLLSLFRDVIENQRQANEVQRQVIEIQRQLAK